MDLPPRVTERAFARLATDMGLDLVAILGDGADGAKLDVVVDLVPLLEAVDGDPGVRNDPSRARAQVD